MGEYLVGKLVLNWDRKRDGKSILIVMKVIISLHEMNTIHTNTMNVSGNALREFHLFAYIKHKLSNRLQSTPKYKYTRIVCLEF